MAHTTSLKLFREFCGIASKFRFSSQNTRLYHSVWQGSPVNQRAICTSHLLSPLHRSFHSSTGAMVRKKISSSPESTKINKEADSEENEQQNSFEPFLIIPNPLRALKNWMCVYQIKSSWDPTFDVDEFKRGSVQALVTVLGLAKSREWGEMRGLISTNLIDTFRTPKPPVTADNIRFLDIDQSNIHLVRVKDVKIQEIVEKKFVDMFVDIIAHRAIEDERRDVGYLFQLKFHREYTSGVLPSWSITGLNMIITSRDWP